ncbi:MAG: hypothetical protein HG427_008060 [Flavobacteriaceae bacterium]|nr:hypothetical protein [Flavobacteriaceae bacterium]
MKKYFLLFFFGTTFGFAQQLSTSLDKQKIELGETAVFKVKIENLNQKNVISAPKNGLLPFSFEETKDSISENPNSYERIIEFTIYEEGKHSIPALEFKIGEEIHRTTPYEIEVTNPTQQGEEINDIMPNEEVELSFSDYWEMYKNYFFGGLVILGILGFVFLFILNRKVKNLRVENPALKTLKKLEQLKNKKLIEKSEYRLFYVELIEICRGYLADNKHIPANILLTEDLIDLMKSKHYISDEEIEVFEKVLTRGDLVKFAKTIPEKNTMESDFDSIKNFVYSTHFNPKTDTDNV